MKIKKEKKKKLVIIGLSLVTVLGSSLAYFTATGTSSAVIPTARYENVIVKTLNINEPWSPGTIADAKFNIENNSEMKIAVRAKFTERWVNANGVELSNTLDDGEAVTTPQIGDMWFLNKSDGWYYLGGINNLQGVNSGTNALAFINGILLNSNVTNEVEVKEMDDDRVVITSTNNGYDGAMYTITVTYETVDYNVADKAWNGTLETN